MNERLFSLWQVMNLFDVYSLAHVLHKLTQAELGLIWVKIAGQGSKPVDYVDEGGRAVRALDAAELLFTAVQLKDCLVATRTAKEQWSRPLLDISAAIEILHRLETDIVQSLESRRFLRIADDRGSFVDNDALFGTEVKAAFPSATRDIKEAGNCLAAECATAAVFHLMRAAEVALRALATDRGKTFAGNLDQKQWGEILVALEGLIKPMREADAKHWPDLKLRDEQIRFYSEVIQELRGFNEAFRKHISHADQNAFYNHDTAAGILKHVRAFMQKLADKISEDRQRPLYWDK